jgi:hypothetical protein
LHIADCKLPSFEFAICNWENVVLPAQLDRLLGLGAVALVALGSVLLLLRLSRRAGPGRGRLVLGYPPELFPAQHLTRGGALAALVGTQSRLASIERQLPPQSDLSIWLRAFLHELRAIMDTAYRVTVITEIYGRPAQLDRLVAEVQQIEAEIAEHVTRRLLARDGDAQAELLDGRLATLRMCVRELAGVAI